MTSLLTFWGGLPSPKKGRGESEAGAASKVRHLEEGKA